MAHCNTKPVRKAGAEVTLPLSSIIRDPLLRSRVGPLDSDHVAGMAESIKAGSPPPRPTVYKIAGRGHFLVGGFHTVAGYELTDVISAGSSLVATVLFLRVWQPAPDPEFQLVVPAEDPNSVHRNIPTWQG